jgi:hypothetical protein
MFCDYCGCEIMAEWDDPRFETPGIVICAGCREEMDREMAGYCATSAGRYESAYDRWATT